MPRAPHSRALLAGRPSAKRRGVVDRISRTRSMPRSRSDVDAVDLGDRGKAPAGCVPHEGVGGVELGLQTRRRSDPFERIGDPAEQRQAIG